MEKRPLRTCVKCGTVLKYSEIISVGAFPCPVCHTKLQVPDSYRQLSFWGSISLVAVLLAALGFRGLHLVSALLFAFVPIVYLEVSFLKYLIPPGIQAYLPKDGNLRLRD
jgi:predicted RNA-binding Zn-ribbon protein involved in translation (DUF1610 family)